jgi:hypothetical protein
MIAAGFLYREVHTVAVIQLRLARLDFSLFSQAAKVNAAALSANKYLAIFFIICLF